MQVHRHNSLSGYLRFVLEILFLFLLHWFKGNWSLPMKNENSFWPFESCKKVLENVCQQGAFLPIFSESLAFFSLIYCIHHVKHVLTAKTKLFVSWSKNQKMLGHLLKWDRDAHNALGPGVGLPITPKAFCNILESCQWGALSSRVIDWRPWRDGSAGIIGEGAKIKSSMNLEGPNVPRVPFVLSEKIGWRKRNRTRYFFFKDLRAPRQGWVKKQFSLLDHSVSHMWKSTTFTDSDLSFLGFLRQPSLPRWRPINRGEEFAIKLSLAEKWTGSANES